LGDSVSERERERERERESGKKKRRERKRVCVCVSEWWKRGEKNYLCSAGFDWLKDSKMMKTVEISRFLRKKKRI